MIRIISDILIFLSIIILSWWMSIIIIIFFLYRFRSFNEVVIFGLIMDIFYGKSSASFNLWDYRFMIFCLIALLSSFYIKKYLKFTAE